MEAWRVAHCGIGVYLLSPDESRIVHVKTGCLERDAVVSPDGSMVVRCLGMFVSAHTVPEFAPLWETRVAHTAQQAAFSHDGTRVVVYSTIDQLLVLHSNTGRVVQDLRMPIEAFAVVHDGVIVFYRDAQRKLRWGWEDGKLF